MDHDEPRFLSYGTVEDEQPIEFVPGVGPIVNVALQPSRAVVRCRVGMAVAGAGEGEYHPFVAGDEVLVALPSGPRGDCAIVCKLANDADAFPTTIGGQDSSQNKLSFARMRCARVEEYEGPYAVFSQPSGAFLSLSKEGNVTLRAARDRETVGSLQINADMLGYQDADATHLLQLDNSAKRFTLRVADALLTLGSSGANAVLSPGALSVSTSGNPAHEHVTTTEAVANLIYWLLLSIASSIPGPISGAALAGVAATVLPAALTAASLAALNPLVAAAVQGAFAAAQQKPPGVPGTGQLLPGIGCPAFFAG